MTGIAKAGEGRAELISGNSDIEAKVMAQLKHALQPALTNVHFIIIIIIPFFDCFLIIMYSA